MQIDNVYKMILMLDWSILFESLGARAKVAWRFYTCALMGL